MTFDPIRSPVDYIVLAGRQSPGIATIEGASTPRNFDERRGFGISFARLRFRGCGLAHFKVLLRLYSEEDWDAWHDWKDLVARPTTASDPRAQAAAIMPRLHAPPMDIEHPILADLEITSVVVEDVLQPVQSDTGEWTIEIRFGEYRAPVPMLEQTAGSRRVVDDNLARQADAYDRTIAALESPEGLAAR